MGGESAPTCPKGWMQEIDECYARILVECLNYCRVPKGGVLKGGGYWGTLRIPREDWGTLGNIRED